jgi:ATP-dependent RNA helicase SUPV3L1/SUV3
MWGDTAVGKLVAGPDPLRPDVEAFVDDEAGPEVAEKVKRRLQHFIDRKVAALFEPLVNLQRDETLTGLTRGFAFRMVEAMGILQRAEVANDVKELDQDARGALRKHGLRFGQYTIFMPLLLKPAPTRLRLVLWSLARGLQEFPESPPPGLVTIPNVQGIPAEHYLLAGYQPAGTRAIRIDMLERLADILRTRDAREGFEASADMLSITGLTLEQFADLMQGLGFAAARGERVKVRPESATPPQNAAADAADGAPAEPAPANDTVAAPPADTPPSGQPAPESPAADPAETAPEAQIPESQDDAASAEADKNADAAPEAPLEVFYTFRRQPRGQAGARGPRRHGKPTRDGTAPQTDGDDGRTNRAPKGASGGDQRGKPHHRSKPDAAAGRPPRGAEGKPGGKPFGRKPGGGGNKPQEGARNYTASPDRKSDRKDKIDPDNPFAAALMALRDRK